MKAFNRIIFIAILTFTSTYIFAQVTISGPTCVIKGTVYQYNISSNWDSTSSMNICLQGGAIADSININACTNSEKPVPYAMVQWDTLGAVSITVTSTSGNATLSITVVNPLIPGTLDTASSFQNIGYDSIPATINCSADTGGSCNPTYLDQWQQSTDGMIWTDIAGATDENLTITTGIQQTTYFRRKVMETNSGTIGYTNVAIVSVNPPPTGFHPSINVETDKAFIQNFYLQRRVAELSTGNIQISCVLPQMVSISNVILRYDKQALTQL